MLVAESASERSASEQHQYFGSESVTILVTWIIFLVHNRHHGATFGGWERWRIKSSIMSLALPCFNFSMYLMVYLRRCTKARTCNLQVSPSLHARFSSARELPDLYDPNILPHWVNPNINVREFQGGIVGHPLLSAGRGRGLVASSSFSPGDLVLAVQPLAILHGPHEEMPEPVALSPALWRVLHHNTSSAASLRPKDQQDFPASSSPTTGWGWHNPLLAAYWMPLLYRGDVQRPHAHHQLQQQQSSLFQSNQIPLLQELLHHPVAPTLRQAASSDNLGFRLSVPPENPSHLAEADMTSIIAHNAFGDEYEDLVASDIRRTAHKSTTLGHSALGQSAHSMRQPDLEAESATSEADGSEAAALSHVGLWPHFALLNHSCLPTCVHYVIGSTMVVRAVREVHEGDELTVSYLGREDFAPAAARQRVLQERFGFSCDCPRCRLEAYLSPHTTELLQRVSRDCKINLGPLFLHYVEEEDRQGLEEVGRALVNWSLHLQPAFEQFLEQAQAAVRRLEGDSSAQACDNLCNLVAAAGGPEAALLLVEATMYDYLELLQQHTQLCASLGNEGGEEGDGGEQAHASAAAALHLCGQVLHAMSRGSELHAFVATRLLEIAQQQQSTGGLCTLEPMEAAQGCEQALVSRYGQVSQQQMARLYEACKRHSRRFIM